MDINKIFLDDEKEIYVIENILSQEDLETLKEFCNKEVGWFNDENNGKTLFYIKPLRPKLFSIMQEKIMEDIINKLEPNLTSSMKMPFLKHSTENTIVKESVSWSILPHTNEDHTKNNKKGFTFFINDNYTGGDFIFLKNKTVFSPKSNCLLVYPASELQGSKEITNGYAYTFTEYLFEESSI